MDNDITWIGAPYKVAHDDYELFLKIFKQARKRMPRGNQYQVASSIKAVFFNTYFYEYKGEYYRARYYTDYNPHSADHVFLKTRVSALKTFIKLSNKTYWNYFGYESDSDFDSALERLAEYFIEASPAAIVQMKKRITRIVNI